MHYFRNTANSMDIFHDDFRFMQDYLIEGIQAIFQGLGISPLDNYIIYGAEVTDNGDGTFSIAEGYVWLNGELLKVPAHTVTQASTGLFVYQKQTELLAGGERDAGGQLYNPWELNYAKAVEVQNILAGDLSIYGRRLNEQIYNFLKSYNPQSDWKIVGNDGGLTVLEANFAETSLPLSWRVTPDHTLQVTGRVAINGNLLANTQYIIADFENAGKYPIDWGYFESYFIAQGENSFGKFGWNLTNINANYWRPKLYFEPFADISQGVIMINCQIPILPLN